MRKLIFGLLAALALCLVLLPGTAEAAELPGLLIQDIMVTAQNMSDVLGDGKVSAAYENGRWTIRLNNAVLTGTISVNHTSTNEPVDAEIVLSGESSVTENRDSASGINASRNLTISGSGSLTVTSEGDGAVGIRADGKLVISGVDVTASSSTSNALYGVGGIEIFGGKVSATAKNEGTFNDTYYPAIFTEGEMVISGSTVSANSKESEGISSTDGIQISNKSSVTGTSLSYALYSPKAISISDSTVNMTSTDHTAVHSAEGVRITEGAEVTLQGCEGCLVVRDVEDGTKTGTLLIDGAKLSATAVCGPGVYVNGQATIQNKAEVTAITKEHSGSNSPGYGLYALGLAVDGSTLSATALGTTANKTQGGIYVGTRDENNPAGDMTVKGDSTVTASGKNNCGITVEGTLSVEAGSVNSQSTLDHGIDVGDTLLILKGSVDSTSEGYRGVNIGKLLDIRNGAEFHAKSTSSSGDEAVAVKSADAIQLGSLCVEESGGIPGPAQIFGKAATVFVDENGARLQEVTITTDSADYAGVNAAIAQIPGDLSVYTSESVAALNSAKNAVNWELPSAQQDTVDGYAQSILAAIAGLVPRPVPPDPPADPGRIEMKTEVKEGISEVPEGLKGIPALDTPAKLESAMRTVIARTGVPSGNTAVYDVKLLVSADGGRTWAPATAANFPSGGLIVTLPYPEGTDKTYTFVVAHMFTTSAFGKTPGDTETPAVTNTEQGIRFTVTGLSPISVGWTAPNAKPDTPSSGGGSSSRGGGGSRPASPITVEPSEHGTVTSDRAGAAYGGPVTLTVLPDGGYGLESLTVTDSRGYQMRLSSQGGGKYAFTMPGGPVTVRAAFTALEEEQNCPSRAFPDLDAGAWYHEAVDYVLRNGLMGGYGNGRFGPDNVLTRAQFAQILYNREGRPAVTGGEAFADVPPGAWCADAVAWAVERGIAGGYGDGRFGPDEPVTREQLAVMLWRHAGSPAAAGRELSFSDADRISGYAREALRWAVENGVMSGRGGGVLDPKGLATRAQAAQMLKNFLEG